MTRYEKPRTLDKALELLGAGPAPAGAGASQDQGGGVPGALAAADARGVGQVLGGVEGLSRGGHR